MRDTARSLVTQAEGESAWNQTCHVATKPNPPIDSVRGKINPPVTRTGNRGGTSSGLFDGFPGFVGEFATF